MRLLAPEFREYPKKLFYPFSGSYKRFSEVSNSNANHFRAQRLLKTLFPLGNAINSWFGGTMNRWESWDYSQSSDLACSSAGSVED